MLEDPFTLAAPYLLFLGDVRDARQAKTASGVYYWRKELCLAQLRLPGCAADLGLPDLTAEQAAQHGARSLLVGLAPSGGQIPDSWHPVFESALRAGLDVISGMHVQLEADPRWHELATRLGRKIIDVRRAPAGIPVGNGQRRSGKRILTVGTDCGVGKMFAALATEREMRRRGMQAEFRATGQTGIMIAGRGICVDAVVSDFTAGAAEMLAPANAPDHWDVIEGQGSLFHPSYAGVTLSLLHGSQPDHLIMCHDAPREMMVGLRNYRVPSLEQCIETNLAAARIVNANVSVLGICANTSAMSAAEALRYLSATTERLGLPACDPVRTGVAPLVDRLS